MVGLLPPLTWLFPFFRSDVESDASVQWAGFKVDVGAVAVAAGVCPRAADANPVEGGRNERSEVSGQRPEVGGAKRRRGWRMAHLRMRSGASRGWKMEDGGGLTSTAAATGDPD